MATQLTKDFLSKVVPWPQGHGFINLHYSMLPDGKDKPFITGKPFADLDAFVGYADWANGKKGFRDFWYCLSSQEKSDVTRAGKPKAMRLQSNAIGLKAIWIDVDIKDDDKHYKTLEEAWQAFTAFRAAAGLPMPSAVVKSGGGLHCYWISDRAMTVPEWAPYAHGLRALLVEHGLKCDVGLTTDSVRLLRVPDTMNFKYDPPRPVELLPLPLAEYDFNEALAFLRGIAPVPASQQVSTLPEGFAGKKPILAADDRLSDGIQRESKPLPLAPIVEGCAFIRESLETGGKDNAQPLWNLSTLAATFLEDGHGLAHRMGRGHPGYSAESTDALYDRKLRERADRGIGWPSCATIQANGCGSCATCPHFAAGKSPLTLGLPTRSTDSGSVRGPAGSARFALDEPPDGFVLNDAGIICKQVIKTSKDGEEEEFLFPLFMCKLDRFWAEKNEGMDALHFRATHDQGNYVKAFVTLEDTCKGLAGGSLGKAHVKIHPANKRFLEEYLVSMLAKLHKAMQAQITRPFGWIYEGGVRKGFTYDNTAFMEDGTEHPAGVGDKRLKEWYQPTGQVGPWMEACDTITSIGRPELDCLIAIAFASPLLEMTGQRGITFNAYGNSGAGKTMAMEIGLAVWADPTRAKEGANTTKKSLLNKMGMLSHLPTYWDEITDPEVQKQAVDTSFLFTGGVEGGRLTSSIEQRDRGVWCCILAMSSNNSLVELVIKTQPAHRGGVNRVLEYHVDKNDPARLGNANAADQAWAGIRHNFGHMGATYSRLLATKHKEMTAEMAVIRDKVSADLKSTQEERFWVAGISAVILGARYGNQLGCKFGLEALERFLYATFRSNRDRAITENFDGGSLDGTDEILAAYLKDRANLQTLWLDGIPMSAGRKHTVQILHGPPRTMNVRDGIQVVWDVPGRRLRISRRDFTGWMEHRQLPTTAVFRGLTAHYTMTQKKIVLAGGTSYRSLAEETILLVVPVNSAMEDIMMMWKELSAGQQPTGPGLVTEVTGLTGPAA